MFDHFIDQLIFLSYSLSNILIAENRSFIVKITCVKIFFFFYMCKKSLTHPKDFDYALLSGFAGVFSSKMSRYKKVNPFKDKCHECPTRFRRSL